MDFFPLFDSRFSANITYPIPGGENVTISSHLNKFTQQPMLSFNET
jgi:hypothetical protein